MGSASGLSMLSAIVWGAALAWLAWTVMDLLAAPRTSPAGDRFERERRAELREVSSIYRNFEPWIDQLTPVIAQRRPRVVEQVGENLVTAAESASWQPAEYLATQRVAALLTAAAVAGVLFVLSGPMPALVIGGATFFLYEYSAVNNLAARASKRRMTVMRRIASAIDLMSVMMDVGASFQESMAVVTAEAGDHPLAEEFRRVLNEVQGGQSRRAALDAMALRLRDDDAAELISAITKGEELGTPLAAIMRNQSEQMQRKRSAWAEKASQEAQVTLVFPAMCIMVACLAIVTAPFILSALYSY